MTLTTKKWMVDARGNKFNMLIFLDVDERTSDDETASLTASMAAAAAANWYGKPEMIPFLSLCSRYPGVPLAGLLKQSIKDKEKKGKQDRYQIIIVTCSMCGPEVEIALRVALSVKVRTSLCTVPKPF